MKSSPLAKLLSTSVQNTSGTVINVVGDKATTITSVSVSVTDASTEVKASGARKSVTIQNKGTNAVTISTGTAVFGTGIILKGGTAANDGLGGSVTLDQNTASITAICAAGLTTTVGVLTE